MVMHKDLYRKTSSDYIFCPECGTQNLIDNSFCSLCGKALRYLNPKTEPKKKPPQKPDKPAGYFVRKRATLLRVKTNESFTINKPIFKIGSNPEICDVVIRDNSFISRNHANIITNKSRFFIIDRKSTNNTFLNGMILPSEVEIDIVSGSKIKLADEEFIFKTE